MTHLKARYQQAIDNGSLLPDSEQAKVVDQLQCIFETLTQQAKNRKHPLKKFLPSVKKAAPGMYLWGGVGIGKTHLLDLLFSCLDLPKKRQHFHAFMNHIHQALFELQGQENPMSILTKRLASQVHVLFLDEFIVEDIADAMVLAGLVEGLIAGGVCLITTSNTEPHNLYKNGWQRHTFLPTIAALEKNTHVMHLVTAHDYRRLDQATIARYLDSNSPDTQHSLTQCYEQLSDSEDREETLTVLGRDVPCVRYSNNVLWATCKQLCSPPRCARGYLDIAQRFPHVIISDVPVFKKTDINSVARFIKLIDVLYDANTHVIISSKVAIDDLYPAGKLTEPFQRTRSRLVEMTRSCDH